MRTRLVLSAEIGRAEKMVRYEDMATDELKRFYLRSVENWDHPMNEYLVMTGFYYDYGSMKEFFMDEMEEEFKEKGWMRPSGDSAVWKKGDKDAVLIEMETRVVYGVSAKGRSTTWYAWDKEEGWTIEESAKDSIAKKVTANEFIKALLADLE